MFKCPECGDSKKEKSSHCYAFRAGDSLRVYCHLCGWSVNFKNFLKKVDPETYRDYMLESLDHFERRDTSLDSAIEVASSARMPEGNPLDGLQRVSDLPEDHQAQVLVRSRMIPRARWPHLYHSDDFPGWANRLTNDRYGKLRPHPRLIIPFVYEGTLTGFQGRAYDNDGVRYLTASLDTGPIVYGWDFLEDGDVPVVEGPIDSMFLSNAIASAGGTIHTTVAQLGDKSRFIVAYDNEPRSVTTVKKMLSAVHSGFRVFVWPESVRVKDFNDWYVELYHEGFEPVSKIMNIMRERTFSDLEAVLEINSWMKCDPDARTKDS